MKQVVIISLLTLLSSLAHAQFGPARLDDEALSRVTAAGIDATVVDGVLHFQGEAATPNGLVDAVGTLSLERSGSNTTTGTLVLSGNAQSNLQALININAVNSEVNVLLNLVVNINSTVGSIVQGNLASRKP